MVDAPDLPPGNLQAKSFLHVVGAAIVSGDGRCLAARRAAHVPNPGFWEFPGGKVEAGEEPRRALEREIDEELGLASAAGDFLGRGEAMLPDGRSIVLDVYLAALAPGAEGAAPRLADHDEARWLAAGELAALDFAPADLPILPALAERLAERLSGSAARC